MRNIKSLVWAGVGLVVLGAVWFWGVRDWWAVKNFSEDEGPMTEREYLRYLEVQELAYQADDYGSTTPEGTLALFVEALRAGDADLASKYFLAEKQAEYREAVTNWVKLGKNENIAAMLEQVGEPFKNEETGQVFMTASDGEGNATFGVILAENKYSQKWKIESL